MIILISKHQKKKIPCQDNKGKIEEIVEKFIINKKLILNNTENINKNTMEPIKTMRYLGNKTDHISFIEKIVDTYKEKHNLENYLKSNIISMVNLIEFAKKKKS